MTSNLPEDRFPRDKDELLREVDARLRLGDIRRAYQLRERLAPKWWETAVVFLLFAAALGLLASLVQYSNIHDVPLNRWMLFWFAVMILTIVLSFEFMLVKIYNLRRSNDLLIRLFEDLHKQTDAITQRLEDLEKRASEKNEQS